MYNLTQKVNYAMFLHFLMSLSFKFESSLNEKEVNEEYGCRLDFTPTFRTEVN